MAGGKVPLDAEFDKTFVQRQPEADEFYGEVMQFLEVGRYVAVVVDGQLKSYG